MWKPPDYFNLRIMNKFSSAAKSSGSLFKHTRLRQDFLRGNIRGFKQRFDSKENIRKLQIIQNPKANERK